MAELLSLSNELLLQIIEGVRMEALENFTLSCKRIFILGEASLAEHRRKKEKYSTVAFGAFYRNDWPPFPKGLHPVYLLRDILDDPSVALYPTKLSIGGCRGFIVLNQEQRDIVEDRKGMLNSALKNCPYISQDEVNIFEGLISRGDIDSTMALLVTLLSNLESIEMQGFSGYVSRFLDVISNIAKAIHGGMKRVHPETRGDNDTTNSAEMTEESVHVGYHHPLGKLSHVYVHRPETKPTRTENFSLLAPFVGIPSVRSLAGQLVEGRDFALQGLKLNSDITTLEFTNSAFNPGVLEELFKSIRSLKHFKFHCFRGATHLPLWLPRRIVSGLIEFQSRSLECLDLRGDDYSGEHFIGSLKDFQKLRTIRLEASMFIEDSEAVMSGRARCGTDYCLDKVHQLQEMLPASVHSVTCTDCGITKQVAAKMLEGLAEQKEINFPLLELVEFEQEVEIPQEVKDNFVGVGVDLRHTGHEIDTKESSDEEAY